VRDNTSFAHRRASHRVEAPLDAAATTGGERAARAAAARADGDDPTVDDDCAIVGVLSPGARRRAAGADRAAVGLDAAHAGAFDRYS